MMRGGCLCGQVQFEADAPLRQVIACHCSQCRKTSGHFWAATSVPIDHFHLTRDSGLAWFVSSDTARRGFCRVCGASLFWQQVDAATICIAVGSLDGPTGLQIEANWHTEDAGDYYALVGLSSGSIDAPDQLQGRCLCGGNRFCLPGPMGEVTACHCSQCRKLSGHFAASFDVREADLIWQAQDIAEFATPGASQRGFCPHCGSSLYFRAADGQFSMEAGCIDNPTGGRLTSHIFVANKGDYYQIDDGLPQD